MLHYIHNAENAVEIKNIHNAKKASENMIHHAHNTTSYAKSSEEHCTMLKITEGNKYQYKIKYATSQ